MTLSLFGKSKAADQRKAARIPLLVGRDTYAALDPKAPGGMIRVASHRACSPMHANFLSNKAPRLHLFVREEIAEKVSHGKLLASGYLRLGLWRSHVTRQTLVLLGGEQDDDGTNLVIMVFSQGELRDVSERFLPPPTAIDYDDLVDSTLQNLRETHPGCRIEQCLPLPRWENAGVEDYHDKSAFLRFVASTRLTTQRGSLPGWIVPVAALALSGSYYSYEVGSNYLKHTALVREGQALQLQLQQHAQQGVSIGLLEARYDFLLGKQTDTDGEALARVRTLASAIQAIPGALINQISANADADQGIQALLRISVPTDKTTTALLQGRDVLDALSEASGYSVRLAKQAGAMDMGDKRMFVIEVLNA